MPKKNILKDFFTFREPRVEPGFVLAWDEPEELAGTKKKEEKFLDERYVFRPGRTLSGRIREDVGVFRDAFSGNPNNLEIREYQVAGKKVAALYLVHAVNNGVISGDILEKIPQSKDAALESIARSLTAGTVDILAEFNRGLEELLQGHAVILADGEKRFVSALAKSAVHRQVKEPISERVIKGPQEGFVEDLDINLALVRKRLRTHRLMIEETMVGSLSRTRCAILSLAGITNPRLLAEVKRRINGIKLDFLFDSGMLEQMIEDNTFFLHPQIYTIERPDRVAAGLAEGKVAVLADGSNLALMMPANLIGFLHAAEDYSVRWPFGVYMRLIRVLSLFVILFLPSLYVAATLFQPEFLPTDILFSLVAIKQKAPLPTFLDILLLEFVFEIIREAGIRSPQHLATPFIIVTGVFIGLASVFTCIINPVLLIVITITGIGAFTLPEFSIALSYRLAKYFYLIMAFLFGYIGIAFGAYLHLHMLVSQKSFGVPMLTPIAPITRRSGDIVLMRPVWARTKRPDITDPSQEGRKPEASRIWLDEQQEKPTAPEGGGEKDDQGR
ncbi:MAG: spore germination protein [Bacillota bacterium]